MSNKITKRKLAARLRHAANIIETFGWKKFSYGNQTRGFCALGGVRHSASLHSESHLKSEYENAANKAFNRYEEVNNVPTFQRYYALSSFNDSKAESSKEVTSMLRKLARSLEHGLKVDLSNV